MSNSDNVPTCIVTKDLGLVEGQSFSLYIPPLYFSMIKVICPLAQVLDMYQIVSTNPVIGKSLGI